MSVIVFSSEQGSQQRLISQTVRNVAAGREVSVFSRTADMMVGLTGRLYEIEAAVLVPSDDKELDALLGLRDFLVFVPCILVLPERTASSLQRGHRLYPRYLTFQDEDVDGLASVLKKMLSKRYRYRD